ncbi:MAG TPA: hypothetical protein VKT77_02395 [Chthonomonadaceae bacterium]|nr:hypothetical protein [Chthonomonadaceae bacterium]
MDREDTLTYRMAFDAPKDTTGKKLTMAEVVDNSGHRTRSLVFGLSEIK